MIIPSCDDIMELSNTYNIIPLCKEIYADIVTPITLLRRIAAISTRYYLLESIEGNEKWSRYSFLGYDPILRATCKDRTVTISAHGSLNNRLLEKGLPTDTPIHTDRPLDILRTVLSLYRAPKLPGTPPFTGGFVGYFGYNLFAYAEPTLNLPPSAANDYDLLLFTNVIAYDHLKQKITIAVNMDTDRIMENYGRACAKIESIEHMIYSQQPLPDIHTDEVPHFTCNFTKEDYCRTVEQTKAHIRNGDIFQAVISRRFTSPYQGSLINAYRVLRTTNPSPYMVCMRIDDEEIICSSPETLVRLKGGRLTTFPVAGSRPRGKDEAQDAALEKDLLSDEKELAEHNMLVDLGRNDLGKISKFSTVKVTEYQMIHKYSRIMHICSQVEGDILDEKDAFDAIEAVLPAGTLSGAPKIRACEIIGELEPAPRGIYGGALGYIDFTGGMDTCIAIRMAVKKDGVVTVQAGGGIVADSVPEKEYEESANKAGALINALQKAVEVNN
jgi:anthranilate synthase component 1